MTRPLSYLHTRRGDEDEEGGNNEDTDSEDGFDGNDEVDGSYVGDNCNGDFGTATCHADVPPGSGVIFRSDSRFLWAVSAGKRYLSDIGFLIFPPPPRYRPVELALKGNKTTAAVLMWDFALSSAPSDLSLSVLAAFNWLRV